MWVRLAWTMPPIQVSTGLLLPPLVTRETRRVCTSLLDIDASSALGARLLHVTWRQGKEKFEIYFLKLQTIRGPCVFLQVTHLCVLEGQWCGVELITLSTYDFPFTYLRLMSGCEETRDSFGVLCPFC